MINIDGTLLKVIDLEGDVLTVVRHGEGHATFRTDSIVHVSGEELAEILSFVQGHEKSA